MNFHFQRQSVPSLAIPPPSSSEGIQTLHCNVSKSIAIYSLFGPQATKVNNTVTSSLPAEHGHKTALPLKYNLMQLFIYAAAVDCIGFRRGQILQQSHTKRSSPCTLARQNAGAGIEKKSWHPPKLPASMWWVSRRKNEKEKKIHFFFKTVKAKGKNMLSNTSDL